MLSNGKTAEGEAALREAMQLDPNYASPHAFLGKLYQPDRALADYDAALRLDPRSAQALYGRGVAKQRTGDAEGAAADFAAAGKISSKVAEGYAALGVRP